MRPGIVEIRDPGLSGQTIDEVPVEAIRTIFGVGEAPFTEARAHTQMLKVAGKWPITTLQLEDWRKLSLEEWCKRVDLFVRLVPSPAIEVGNEPGSRIPRGVPIQDVWNAYWPRLKAASAIIRDAGKKVILGGQPPGGSFHPGAEAFLRRADEMDIWPHVDFIGLHPYLPTPAQQLKYLRKRRDQLNHLGVLQPFVLTEFGWGTAGEGPMAVDEPVQAAYLATAFHNFQAKALRIEAAAWFSWRDWGAGRGWSHRCGVRRLDGSPKPSYAALKDLAA